MVLKSIKALLVAVFSLFVLLFSTAALAQENKPETVVNGETATHGEKLDPSKIIMDHIKDDHEFHFFTAGSLHATIQFVGQIQP